MTPKRKKLLLVAVAAMASVVLGAALVMLVQGDDPVSIASADPIDVYASDESPSLSPSAEPSSAVVTGEASESDPAPQAQPSDEPDADEPEQPDEPAPDPDPQPDPEPADDFEIVDLDDDDDGLTDEEEAQLGTDPNDKDTDNDFYSDKTEVDEGTDPLDSSDHPNNDITL